MLFIILSCTSCRVTEYTVQECYAVQKEVEDYLSTKYPFEDFKVQVESNHHKPRGFNKGSIDIANYYYLTISCTDSTGVNFIVTQDDTSPAYHDTYMHEKWSTKLADYITEVLTELGDESACFDKLSITQSVSSTYFGDSVFETFDECLSYAKENYPLHIYYNTILIGDEQLLNTDIHSLFKYYKDMTGFNKVYLFVRRDDTCAVFTTSDSKEDIANEVTRIASEMQLEDTVDLLREGEIVGSIHASDAFIE